MTILNATRQTQDARETPLLISAATSSQLGSLPVSPIDTKNRPTAVEALPPNVSTAFKVHHQVGGRGYVVTRQEIATDPSFLAPRILKMESREIGQNDYQAFLQSGLLPKASSADSLLSDDVVIAALKKAQMQPASAFLEEVPLSRNSVVPSSFSFLPQKMLATETAVRHIPGTRDLSLRITEISQDPSSNSLPIMGASEERIVSEEDFERMITQSAISTAREDDSLESILAEKGLRFAEEGDPARVQTVGGINYVLGKYVFNPLSKGCRWIEHKGNYLVSSQYREQYDYAVKRCQEERFPYQVYSKDQIDAQLNEVSRLINEIHPYTENQIVADLNMFTTTFMNLVEDKGGSKLGAAARGGGKTGLLLKFLSMVPAAYQEIQAYSPEAEKLKHNLENARSKLSEMINENQSASYKKSIETSYTPPLYFKSDLTKEEARMACWGIDFLVDNQGFQFGISVDTSF
ncbi:MAG: hypothetical protein KGJ02_07120 [Verrucomicrobiota bacterium]|nr:hypothetical protein [Verrucomicrobiota bacterium]